MEPRSPSRHRIAVTAVTAGVVISSIVSSVATSAADDDVEIRYRAASGETNLITLVEVDGGFVITDSGAAALPRSLRRCTPLVVPVGISAECPAVGEVTITIDLGDGDDELLADMLSPRFTLYVDGGSGADVVEPGDGDDRIVGGPGDDTLYGGLGDDEVLGQGGSDYLNGSPGDDLVDGGGGFDFVLGDAGDDRLIGGGDIDYLYGAEGDDRMEGGPAFDFADGGPGDDTLLGGPGDDELFGDSGSDVLDGAGGNDLLRSLDGESDRVDCGAGNDEANLDRGAVPCARPGAALVRDGSYHRRLLPHRPSVNAKA